MPKKNKKSSTSQIRQLATRSHDVHNLLGNDQILGMCCFTAKAINVLSRMETTEKG